MSFNGKFYSSLKSYFVMRHGAFDYKHGWMKMDCPVCGKEKKFGVNISRNRTNCFVCGYNKKPIDLLMEVEGLISYHDVFNFLEKGGFDGYEYKPEKVELRKQNDIYLPEGFRLLNQGESQMARSARSYMSKRGFDIGLLSKKGWGYCVSGKYSGYIIIPFFSRGKLIYFNARNYMSNGPRYNNPDLSYTGLGKAMIIYNQDALSMYNSIYICEGAINAETIGDRAIACGGKSISAYQVNNMIKSDTNRYIILLDPDALDKAIHLALALIDYKRVKLVILPDGKDVNNIGKDKTLHLVYKTRYQSRQDLIRLKNNL